MKHLFRYIVFFFLIFNSSPAFCIAPSLPDDFEGKVTRQRAEEYIQNPESRPQMAQFLFMLYEVGDYLYHKYDIKEFENEDFIDNLRPFFPEDTDAELQDRRIFFKRAFSTYKQGKDLYVKFAKQYLVPHTYRKVHSASEYDHYGEVPYIEPQPNKFVKVYNFKKFLTYSMNEDERNAISDFERSQKDNDDILVQIDRIAEKIEWKKVFLYGTVYKNPLFSDLGISQEINGDYVSIGLLSRNTYTHKKSELDFGLHIRTKPGIFVLANNISPNLNKPTADFSLSENVKHAEFLYPMPLQTVQLPYAHKYIGDFMIPFKIYPQDPQQPVIVRATGTLTVCNPKMKCEQQPFSLKLKIDAEGAEQFSNGFENFFFLSLNRVPHNDLKELKLQHIGIKKNKDNRQTLLLIFETTEKLHSFSLFIEDNEGYTKFSAPRYTMLNNKIYAYVEALDDTYADLTDTEYTISANLNNRYMYRTSGVAAAEPENSSNDSPLNISLWLSAVFCGICLSLTPGTLLFLILSYGAARYTAHHLNQPSLKIKYYLLGGLIIGFLILTGLLLYIRQNHILFIPGYQFGNTGYITTLMLLAITGISMLPTLLNAINLSGERTPRLTFTILGGLGVLGATWFPVPHLSNLITSVLYNHFNYFMVIISGLMLGFGLSLGILFVSAQSFLKPFIERHIRNLPRLLKILLYVLIFWFGILILSHNGWKFTAVLAAVLIIWGFICGIYQKFIDYTEGVLDESISPENLHKIRKGCKLLMLGLFILITGLAVAKATKYQSMAAEQQNTNQQFLSASADKIAEHLKQNQPVLVMVDAPWCLSCRINSVFRLNNSALQRLISAYGLQIYKINPYKPSPELKSFLQQYNQSDLPLYILYTPLMPKGLVLPKFVHTEDISGILAGEFNL